jgi:hypothetical protein
MKNCKNKNGLPTKSDWLRTSFGLTGMGDLVIVAR